MGGGGCNAGAPLCRRWPLAATGPTFLLLRRPFLLLRPSATATALPTPPQPRTHWTQEPAYLLRERHCVPDLVHDLNRHGGVVVAGLPEALPLDPGAAVVFLQARAKAGDAGAAPDAAAADEAAASCMHTGGAGGLDDLHAPEAVDFEALTITDPREYFGSGVHAQAGGAGAPAADADYGDLCTLAAALADAVRADPASPPVAQADAARVLADLAADSAEPGDGVLAPGADAASALIPQLRALVRDAVLPVNEALRFFWAAQPVSTPGRKEKAARLAAYLKGAAVRVQALQEAGTGSERMLLARMLQPTADAIDTALRKAQEAVAG